jgi:large subunit ribosomal protein L23
MNKPTMTLKPRMTEKTYAMSQTGVYVFDVDTSVNKHEIAAAVEGVYEVSVETVRTVTVKGKAKRMYRKRRYENGRRSDVKKAYVTLKEGDQIPIFAAVEEEKEQSEKAQKTVTKIADKKAAKEAKKSLKKEKKGAEK